MSIAACLQDASSTIQSSVKIDVGDQVLARQLRKIFPDLPVQDLSVYARSDNNFSRWRRDCRVQNPLTHTVLPVLKLHEDLSVKMDEFEVQLYPSIALVNYIEKADIKSPVMQKPGAYVEGGNVFYCLLNKEGQLEDRLAVIIGMTTVLWTRAHLESVHYFTESILGVEKEYIKKNAIADYGDLDKMAKWRLSLRVIAEHVGVLFQNVICLEHNLALDSTALCLHIDLNIALGPHNKVFVHSPKKVQEELLKVGSIGIRYAKQELLEADQQITERNCSKLKEYGFEVIPIAGYYGSLTDEPLQETYFLNGVFFEHKGRNIFVTAAAQHGINAYFFSPPGLHFHALSEAFSKAMAVHDVCVIYINFISHLEGLGGVHCLTNEIKEGIPFSPSVIPVDNMIEKIPTLVVFRLSKKIQDTAGSLSLFLDGQSFCRFEAEQLKASSGSLSLHVQVPLEGVKLTFHTDIECAGSCQLLPGHPREVIL